MLLFFSLKWAFHIKQTFAYSRIYVDILQHKFQSVLNAGLVVVGDEDSSQAEWFLKEQTCFADEQSSSFCCSSEFSEGTRKCEYEVGFKNFHEMWKNYEFSLLLDYWSLRTLFFASRRAIENFHGNKLLFTFETFHSRNVPQWTEPSSLVVELLEHMWWPWAPSAHKMRRVNRRWRTFDCLSHIAWAWAWCSRCQRYLKHVPCQAICCYVNIYCLDT